MDFDWSDAQHRQRERILAFARERLGHDDATTNASDAFDRDAWAAAADFGLTGLPIPRTWGGESCDVLDTILAVEALGYGAHDTGLVFSLCAHTFACAVPIWTAGSDDQRRRFLTPVARGRWIGANAASELNAGSDIFALETTATKRGTRYLLDGKKSYVTNGPIADVFVVYATLNREAGPGGITAFVVTKDQPGLEIGATRERIGLRSSPLGELRLTNCEVPADQRLGPEGAGAVIFADSMRWERACLFAMYVGAMQRTFDSCLRHAKARRQFGQPIGKFQSVANMLIDMRLRLETSRLLMYHAGWLLQQRKGCELEVALSKLHVSESAVRSGLDAVQVFGALGCLADSPVAGALLDAIPARIFSGTSEMQRVIAARCLGL